MKPVKVYTKDYCPYCIRAKKLLDHKKVSYEEISLTEKPELAEPLFSQTGFRTVPQIFIGEECVGGFDQLSELERAGKLDAWLGES